MKAIRVAVLPLVALLFVSQNTWGSTLRNTDYMDVEVGTFAFGDEVNNDIFGSFIDIFGSFNKTMNDNAALLTKVEYITADGSSQGVDLTFDGIKAGISFVYLLSPGTAADPYALAGALGEYNRIEGSSSGYTANDDDTEAGFELGGGLEFDLDPKSVLDLGLLYQSIGDFDSIAANARVGFVLNEKTTLVLAGSYAFDEEDYYARVGVAIKL